MDAKTNIKDPFNNLWARSVMLSMLLLQFILMLILLPIFYITKAVRMMVKIYLRPISWIWILILFVVWYLTGSFLLACIISLPIGLVVLWPVTGKIQAEDKEKEVHRLDQKVKQWLEWKYSRDKH